MTDKELKEISDSISDFILLEKFSKNGVNVPDALTVLASVTTSIIRSLCSVIGEDAERMITVFCNGMQQPLVNNRHYSSGSKDGDEILKKIVEELKQGGDVEEIVDKYIAYPSLKQRQEVIDGLKEAVKKDWLDNVKIGY